MPSSIDAELPLAALQEEEFKKKPLKHSQGQKSVITAVQPLPLSPPSTHCPVCRKDFTHRPDPPHAITQHIRHYSKISNTHHIKLHQQRKNKRQQNSGKF